MSSDALPKYHELMRPVLLALQTTGGSASIEEINDRVVEAMKLSLAQLAVAYPASGALIVADRISWARSYLRIAGLLCSAGKGVWVLNDRGREALGWPEPQLKRFVADEAKRRAADRKLVEDPAQPSQTSSEDPETARDWKDDLLDRFKTLDPSAFERLAQRLLRESGFMKVEVTGQTGDGGIDGAGVLRMNLISFQVLFQCKRYRGSVGAGVVRDFRGAMQGRANKGLVITTGTFTPDARREATRDGAPVIDLIDGDALCLLLRDLRLGVVVRAVTVERIEIEPQFFSSI